MRNIFNIIALTVSLILTIGINLTEGADYPTKPITLITLGLTILMWLCLCLSGAALAVMRTLGPK